MPDRLITLFNGRQVNVPDTWSNAQILAELDPVESMIKQQIQGDVSGTRSFDVMAGAVQQGRLMRSPMRTEPERLPQPTRAQGLQRVAAGLDPTVLDQSSDRVRGFAKQIGSTAARVAAATPAVQFGERLGHRLAPTANVPTLHKVAEDLRPSGPAEEAGGMAADMVTGMLPFGAAGKVAAGLEGSPFLARKLGEYGINAAAGAGTAGAQGHSPLWGAGAGAAVPLLSDAAGWAKQKGVDVARSILNSKGRVMAMFGAPDAVATRAVQDQNAVAALENKALPGFVRRGDRRVTDRIDAAERLAQGLAESSPQHAATTVPTPYPKQPTGGTAFPTENRDLAERYLEQSSLPTKPLNQAVRAARKNPALDQATIPEALSVARSTRMSALEAPANSLDAVGQRAVSRDLMDAAATRAELADLAAGPQPARYGPPTGARIADELRRAKALMPVQESDVIRPVDEGGVGTNIKGRILISTANRLAGPIAQGLWNVGTTGQALADSTPFRAAMAAVMNRRYGDTEP